MWIVDSGDAKKNEEKAKDEEDGKLSPAIWAASPKKDCCFPPIIIGQRRGRQMRSWLPQALAIAANENAMKSIRPLASSPAAEFAAHLFPLLPSQLNSKQSKAKQQ